MKHTMNVCALLSARSCQLELTNENLVKVIFYKLGPKLGSDRIFKNRIT